MYKTIKKILSVFLSFLMVIQILPMSAWAQEITQRRAIQDVDTSSNTNTDEVVIEKEIESMRTEKSKTFLTEDNGYYQITSAFPMHNLANGVWVDRVQTDLTEMTSVSDIEQYIEQQTSGISEMQIDENETETDINTNRTITSSGDTYVENCQTAIGTYSSTGTDDLSVIYARTGRTTRRSEIYVKPYFPTDHAIFVTDAKIKADIYNENIIGAYNLIEVNQISQDWTAGSQDSRLNAENSTNYDITIYINN